ncbi:MAG: DUF2283 domain-containing protein [Syntrophales bacterium]
MYFVEIEKKSAETVTIKPGVYADFDKDGKLISIEIIDAKEIKDLRNKKGVVSWCKYWPD